MSIESLPQWQTTPLKGPSVLQCTTLCWPTTNLLVSIIEQSCDIQRRWCKTKQNKWQRRPGKFKARPTIGLLMFFLRQITTQNYCNICTPSETNQGLSFLVVNFTKFPFKACQGDFVLPRKMFLFYNSYEFSDNFGDTNILRQFIFVFKINFSMQMSAFLLS